MSLAHRHNQHNADRRHKLFSKMENNSACLLSASSKVLRNSDVEYQYRQDSHFFYLTGWPEDEAIVVLLKKGDTHRFILFCQEPDDHETRWVGPRIGVDGALRDYHADEAYPIEQLDSMLPEMLAGLDKLYYPIGSSPLLERKLHQTLKTIAKFKRQGWQAPKHHIELYSLLDELRLFKMGDEVARMRKAASISAQAHAKAMAQCYAGMNEYELEAIYRYEFMKHGAKDLAYLPIVAGGANACILHYTQNNQKIKEGDLVLVDAGCEFQNYASDITRTFPASGKFSKAQQEIYELVLASQMAALDEAKAGRPWNAMQQVILKVLVQGLIDLKILTGSVDELIAKEAYKPYYMHQSGHWLGLDVHDVGAYKINQQWRMLEPGMMLTVEPGLYFPEDDATVPEAYKGIGVRIEDDVLITDSVPDILSQEAPKTVHEIEALMKSTQ